MSRSTWRFGRGYTEQVSSSREGAELVFVFHVCSHALSFCSSQWQHKQQSGALVVLWSSGSGGNDTRTDLLPEEIFWSTTSSVVRLKNVPLCPPLFSPTPRHVFIRWKWDSILSEPPHLIGSRIFLFSCYRWVPFKKEIKAHAFWNRCPLCSIFFKFHSVQLITSQFYLWYLWT